MGENETIVNLMKTIPFFRELTNKEMDALAKLGSNVMRFNPSEPIIQEGEVDFSIYIILKGLVRVVKSKPKETTLTKLKPGAIFGELAWVGNRPRTTSVIANGDVIALKLDLKSVNSLGLALAKKIQDQFIKILISRLEKVNEQLSHLVR